jgi:hypothetical protein
MKRLLLCLIVSCAPARSPSLAALDDVCTVAATSESAAVQLLSERAPGPRVGSLYGVVDDEGWVGLVKVTADPGADYDDGPEAHRVARYVTTTARSARQIAYAFGPIDGPFPNAKLITPSHISRDHSREQPEVDLAIDLDGDGKQDLEQRLRCVKMAGSGCAESCRAVFVRGGDTWRLASERCGSAALGG